MKVKALTNTKLAKLLFQGNTPLGTQPNPGHPPTQPNRRERVGHRAVGSQQGMYDIERSSDNIERILQLMKEELIGMPLATHFLSIFFVHLELSTMSATMFLLVLFSVLSVATAADCKCEVEYYIGSSSCSSIFSPDTDMKVPLDTCTAIASAQSSLFPSGGLYYKVSNCTNQFVAMAYSDSICNTSIGSQFSYTADGKCTDLATLSFLGVSANLGSVKFTCSSGHVFGPVWYLVAMCLGVIGLLKQD